jgi:hypothetical protein
LEHRNFIECNTWLYAGAKACIFPFSKKEILQKLYKNFTRVNLFWKIQDSGKKLPEFKVGLTIDSFRSVMTFTTDKVCRVTYCMINSEDDCALNYTAIDGILPFFHFI